MSCNVVIVPGWHGSGPAHWQTIWEQNHPEYVRVAHRDWCSTHCPDWVMAVDRAVISSPGDVVLVAHSLGCLAVVWWASLRSDCARWVQGALLVAPPNLSSATGTLPALSSFTPLPAGRLPFRSLLIASENGPYTSIEAAAGLARKWGSEFIDVGAAGHINADSGHGQWLEGERHLQRFRDSVRLPALLAAG
jgi:predicted alpha/beta hydrolase family esterase